MRHHDVEAEQIGLALFPQRQRLAPVARKQRGKALRRHAAVQRIESDRIVVSEQDFHATAEIPVALGAGTRNSKAAPRPLGISRSEPPMLAARSRAMARPRPVPVAPSFTRLSSLSKGRKMRSAASAGMPGPSSLTTIASKSASSVAAISTMPPGTYFSTFESRFA